MPWYVAPLCGILFGGIPILMIALDLILDGRKP